MEIAIIVFSVILLNTFLYNTIDILFGDWYLGKFDRHLIWFFAMPIFVFMFVSICGRLFGKGLSKLEKIGRK